MSGWGAFLARRIPFLDSPFRAGWLPTTSRYLRWTRLLDLESPDTRLAPPPSPARRIGIHVGAQWGARKYPNYPELARLLETRGIACSIVGGPGDDASRILTDEPLLRLLRDKIDLLICNESAPMHIARAVGAPTAVVFANTGIDEWLPPGALAISRVPPGGYAPRYPYQSDDPISGGRPWPSPAEIVERLARESWIAS